MTATRAVPIGGERFTTADSIEVRSPFDGHEIGRVPRCSEADVERAVAAATAARRDGPLPAWRRAEILDRASAAPRGPRGGVRAHHRRGSRKADQDPRVEARRAVSTFTFAAVEARRLSGEMIPMDAADVGEGKLAFTLRVPIGVVGAISPFNFPLNLVAHKLAPPSRPAAPWCSSPRARPLCRRSRSPSSCSTSATCPRVI